MPYFYLKGASMPFLAYLRRNVGIITVTRLQPNYHAKNMGYFCPRFTKNLYYFNFLNFSGFLPLSH